MLIVKNPISITIIKDKNSTFFETMVKIVVDIEREILALDAEMHADLEQLLLEEEAEQKDLWGANIYFEKPYDLEFTSLINIRPAQGNRSMEVRDENIRRKMTDIVKKLILL
ncbi:hypothetical protein HZA40_01210 [Candidatus Peregrinibacteria bacterium]|nr:hypothetical protein [Candidatus Peregrinibacteria bacterium]